MEERVILLEWVGVHSGVVLKMAAVGAIHGQWLCGGQGVCDRCTFFNTGWEVTVHSEYMVCNLSVARFLDVVGDDKQQIETGQEGVGKCNVTVRIFVYIILRSFVN